MSSRKRNKSARNDQPVENRPAQASPAYVFTAAQGRLVLGLMIGALLCGVIVWQVQAFTAKSAIQKHIAQGKNFVRANNGNQAEKEFRAAIAADPKNVDAWMGLADLLFSYNNYRDARDAYAQIAKIAPAAPHVSERLTVCSSKLDDSVAALTYAAQTLKQDPNNVAALNVTVDQQIKNRAPEKALDEMRLLAKLQQNDFHSLLKVARALYLQHLYAEAIPILDRVIQLDPSDGKVYFLRGVDRLNNKPTDSGMALVENDFKQFLQFHPGSYLPHRYLAKAYQKMGKWDKAASELEQVASAHPEMTDVYVDLHTIYRHMNQPAKDAAATAHFNALRKDAARAEQLEKICAADQGNFNAFMELGRLYYKSGNFKRSGSAFLHAGQVRPNDPGPQAELQKVETAMAKATEDARFWMQ